MKTNETAQADDRLNSQEHLLLAHSGGTDSSGCHHNRRTGGYHCHSGSGSSSYSSRVDLYRQPENNRLGDFLPARPSTVLSTPSAGQIKSNQPIEPPPGELPPLPTSTTTPDKPQVIAPASQSAPSTTAAEATATSTPSRSANTGVSKPVVQQQLTQQHTQLSLSDPATALTGGALLGWLAFTLLRRQQRVWKVGHSARAIQQELERHGALLYAKGKTVIAVESAKATGNQLEVKALQLDYSPKDDLKTSIHQHSINLPAAAISLNKTFISRSRIPRLLPINQQWLERLDDGSEYNTLVIQHHKAWKTLQSMDHLEKQLVREITRIEVDGLKYRETDALPQAAERLLELKQHKSEQLQAIRKELPALRQLLSVLTLRIESIEDFGGVLLGYERPEDYQDQNVSEQSQLLIETVREELASQQAQLEAYAELLNQSSEAWP